MLLPWEPRAFYSYFDQHYHLKALKYGFLAPLPFQLAREQRVNIINNRSSCVYIFSLVKGLCAWGSPIFKCFCFIHKVIVIVNSLKFDQKRYLMLKCQHEAK